jgi:hypothetical protein
MEGPNNPDEAQQGMIPRAVSQIFKTSYDLEDKGWKVIECCCVYTVFKIE